jgi:L-fuculose-phosphate aldolase
VNRWPAEREHVVVAATRLVAEGLCVGTAGNVSVRVPDGVLITPSGVPADQLHPGLVVHVDREGCPVGDGEGSPAPSSELPMHLAAYAAAEHAAAVVHTHSRFATVAGTLLPVALPAVHYEVVALGGPPQVVPYARFGSDELAEGLRRALAERHAALLQNHGAVVVAPDLARAFARAQLLEWLCEVWWRAAAVGSPRVLDDAELDEVGREMARRRYGDAGPPALG